MILTALPDWSRPLDFGEGRGFFLFHRDTFAVLPGTVVIPANSSGLPDMELQFLRSAMPFSESANYALLTVSLQPELALERARTYLLEIGASAGVQGLDLSRGRARYQLPEMITREEVHDELEAETPLAAGADNRQTLSMRLSETAGLFWRELILDNTLLVKSHLLYQITGVAPRSPHEVRFDPQAVAEHLAGLADNQGTLPADALQASLLEDFQSWPIVSKETPTDAEMPQFAESLKDHLLAHFAGSTFISEDDQLQIQIPSINDFSHGSWHWDLSQPMPGERLWQVDASPFEAWQNTLSEEQRRQLIQIRTLPFIDRGKTPFHLHANLGVNAPSLVALGAHIRQAAAPPDRPQKLIRSLDVLADQGRSTTDLFIGDDGALEYTYQGFVAIETDRRVIELHASEQACAEHLLVLNPNDFAVQTLSLELAAVWRGKISVETELVFEYQGTAHSIKQPLNADQPSLTLALPHGNDTHRISLQLNDLAGEGSLKEEISPSGHTVIGPLLLPQCGPQELLVRGSFSDQQSLLAVELLAMDADTELDAPQIIHLTPQQPQKSWRWYVHSPFEAGYQFRLLDSLGNPNSGWLQMKYPFTDLLLGNTTSDISQAHQ